MESLAKMLSGSRDGTLSHKLDEVRLISGNSHPGMAKAISEYLGMKLVECKLDKFSNGEIHAQILENIRRKKVVIIQTGCEVPSKGYSINDVLWELLTIVNALTLSSVVDITAVIPNFFYARQDKKDVSRAPISGRLVAEMLQAAGVTRVVTMDLHASQIAGFFKIPVDNLFAVNVFAEFAREYFYEDIKKGNLVVVAPDAGAAKRMDKLASLLKLPSAIMHKSRNHQEKSVVLKTVLVGENDCVKDKKCLIIDDMCDTAGTIVKASKTLMEHGANGISIIVTHGILSGPALDRLNEADFVKDVIVTNTLPQEENIAKCPKIKVVDISTLLGETVRRLHTGESISALF